jgi:hypothetical protein
LSVSLCVFVRRFNHRHWQGSCLLASTRSTSVKSAKFYADSLGSQNPADQSGDVLPAVRFPELGKSKTRAPPLLLVKRRLRPATDELRRGQSAVAVDPCNMIIDRRPSDSTRTHLWSCACRQG